MSIVFLDTNILLDFLLRREGVDNAKEILKQGYQGKIDLYVSSLSFSNIAYIVRKQFKGEALYKMLTTIREMVSIVSVDVSIIDNAINSQAPDFEDAIQYFSAKDIKADYIVTNNIKDFLFSNIKVLTSKEFVQIHQY